MTENLAHRHIKFMTTMRFHPLSIFVLFSLVPASDGPKFDLGSIDGTSSDASPNPTADDNERLDLGSTETTVDAPPTSSVDVLFVIDNSGSMSNKQGRIAAAVGSFARLLDDQDAAVDYRLAFTTTDTANPWCTPLGPEDQGRLRLTSCRNRLNDFKSQEQDVRATGCTDVCSSSDEELELSPTATHLSEGEKSVRPWLEVGHNRSNLPDGIAVDEAARCFAPQGIYGCGFSTPLEAQYLALEHASDPANPAYGFLRPEALLVIVHITDNIDCSDRSSEIFSSIANGGNQIFWPNPSHPYPTLGVCWNAGVSCTQEFGAIYGECHTQDKDIDGQDTLDKTVAVMHPTSRYTDQLKAILAEKREINSHQEIIITQIVGVDDNGVAIYTDEPQGLPDFVDDYGIGPGCTEGGDESRSSAPPPVRMREVAEAFDGRSYSVCAENYAQVFVDLGIAISENLVR